ncbi:expressed unknown protein [Seminavis robusta]|uniref:Uncharacterized protein n=1 Tax=Seminavis robusta TaxID=568900 RepID=A0A9N8EGK2_9STRA|nr:expressed unknown protein [Seminavis robusta]|eukprot:Sro914_g219521.1  (160) ;mRNA; f:4671-5150
MTDDKQCILVQAADAGDLQTSRRRHPRSEKIASNMMSSKSSLQLSTGTFIDALHGTILFSIDQAVFGCVLLEKKGWLESTVVKSLMCTNSGISFVLEQPSHRGGGARRLLHITGVLGSRSKYMAAVLLLVRAARSLYRACWLVATLQPGRMTRLLWPYR